MTFNPLETGLWDRKHQTIEDMACTLVNLEPRISILTMKLDGKYQDFIIGPVQAAELAELLRYALEVPEDVAQANDESPERH